MARSKPSRNITPSVEEWALAVAISIARGISVSQLFGQLVRTEHARIKRRPRRRL